MTDDPADGTAGDPGDDGLAGDAFRDMGPAGVERYIADRPGDGDAADLPAESLRTLRTEIPRADVTDEQLRSDGETAESWLHYNKGVEQLGYSPADRLTPANVDSLKLRYDLPVETEDLQTNPIVVPGDPPVMYYTDESTIEAVNARTGDSFWTYAYVPVDHEPLRDRGVAVWKDTVFFGGPDLRILALDRYTGERQWRTWGISERQAEVMDKPERLGHTQAPFVFDGRVYVGQRALNGGWGDVLALDAETGERLWSQTLVPPEEWVGESWQYGGCAAWMTPAADPESGTVVFGTGNPGVEVNGTIRPGPNKHGNSVVALDAETGELLWTNQLVANDWWDYDTGLVPRIIDVEVDGDPRRAVSIENKQGWSWLLDVETGRLLERSEAFVKQGVEGPEGLGLNEMPPATFNRIRRGRPHPMGATMWSPDAFSPQTGLVYLGANEQEIRIYHDPTYVYDAQEISLKRGGEKLLAPGGDRASAMKAIDPATGEVVWTEEYEVPSWGNVHAGGTTATAGGLVFGGTANGMIVCCDAATGERLWDFDAEAGGRGVIGGPVIWDDPGLGSQFLAVAADDRIVVLAGSDPDGTTTTTSDGEETIDDEATTDATGPGFGVVGTLGALAGAAASRLRRSAGSSSDDE